MTSHKMQNFGEYIKQLRTQKGFTLTQLAAKLGIDSANLSKIENDKRPFDEKKLPALCKIFSLNLEDMKKELLSEKIAKKVYDMGTDSEVFLLAEKKVEYMKQSKPRKNK
ncbi:MAG: helix-turn-helix transcriptional regulator [Bacteroidetes bacterium]|nr:helix-turn-helix transcriptional regulator [Bacteroidota bacterium]